VSTSRCSWAERDVGWAKATQAQVTSVYGLSDSAEWKKFGVTPMLGVNDSQNEIFYQKDARALVSFASGGT
jgi:hypothetical protein